MGQKEERPASKTTLWDKVVGGSAFWRKVAGWFCIFIGLLGIILPILPGIPFLVAGVALLATEYRWARALLIRLKRKLGRRWPQKVRIPRARRRSPHREEHPL